MINFIEKAISTHNSFKYVIEGLLIYYIVNKIIDSKYIFKSTIDWDKKSFNSNIIPNCPD